MVDLETHSTETFAAIASIAAASFNPQGNRILSAFYRNIDPKSCEDIGLNFDPKVAAWWEKQEKEARDALLDNQVSIEQALLDFKTWFSVSGSLCIWSQGASFDIPILANAYSMIGIRPPWHFMKVRDTRTLYDVSEFDVGSVSRGIKHHAAGDVIYQIKCVQGSYSKLSNLKK
jgi:hypothetical protein